MPLPGFSSKSATTGFDKAKVVRAAEKNLSQGKISAAIKEYRKLVDFDAKDFMALNMLGDLYVRQDKKEDAIACFSRIADHYREQGFALKAIAMYKKIDRLTPNTPQIAFRLAGLYAQLGMVVEARSEYLIVAEAYTRSGQTQKALEILRRIADLDPHNAEVRLKLAESYLREGFRQEAAEAFTESGNQLAAQGQHERAQSAYNQTLALFPEDTGALKGLVGTHIALGTANEAAEMLETALADRPGDIELLELLVRAYLEEKDPAAAEGAVSRLIERQPTSYQDFVAVARLYLKAGETEPAVRVTGRIVEPMLAGREDAVLLELLQEALDRDPDQIQALHLLIRIHTWQRDDEKLRASLDRLAEAAEAAGLADEERSALKQLLRFAPSEERYHNRLRELGVVNNPFGVPQRPAEPAAAAAPPVAAPVPSAPSAAGEVEVPTFESFMLAYEEPKGLTPVQDAKTYQWEDVAQPSSDPDSSFADLNDEYGTVSIPESNGNGNGTGGQRGASFQDLNAEIPEGVIAGSPSFQTIAGDAEAGEGGNDQMLRQELDSVDFYLAQGYNDIAQDTLDMLERQYGSHAEIRERRARLKAADPAAASSPSQDNVTFAAADEVDFQGAT
ncbi:MAG TPA: tetratricopeptide repeat protein, partial [Pyrinomonadaceae bacterium]|nr:tetratricopeptide repeat protein [Pyrinomonadaceae bacterium]